LCLFLFTGEDIISMRMVAELIGDGGGDPRSLERRPYLAISFLEIVTVVVHTPKSSEYRILIDRREIVQIAMRHRQEYCARIATGSSEGLLNRYDQRFLNKLYADRRDQLSQLAQ
jgi:hypothetical protein